MESKEQREMSDFESALELARLAGILVSVNEDQQVLHLDEKGEFLGLWEPCTDMNDAILAWSKMSPVDVEIGKSPDDEKFYVELIGFNCDEGFNIARLLTHGLIKWARKMTWTQEDHERLVEEIKKKRGRKK